MLRRIRHFLELIRFSHTVFALPFALLAAVMAWRERAGWSPPQPWRWTELLGIVACMVFARSTAMAFNRVVDRKLDAQNPRTTRRHLPAGLLSTATVVALAALCAIGFIAGTLLFLPQNRWPLLLSGPVLAFICGYSFAKRFTALAHFWLGAALFLAPVCAWIALAGFANIWPAILLGAAVMFWVAGFDIIYACQDVEADRAANLYSIPAAVGPRRALWLAAACHVATVALLFALPLVFPDLSWLYLTGIAAVTVLLVYEHALVRPDDLTRVNVAFFHVNAVISVGLLLVGSLDLWLIG